MQRFRYDIDLHSFPTRRSSDLLVRIVSGERRQIHASDGTQEPSRLPFLLYRSPRTDGLRPALDSAGVHAHRAHPIQIERYAAVGLEITPGEAGDGRIGR